ncbi:NUDIX hydrolase [Candidatus Gracilibacteria bacterium]|nr:NUDIX hydrolase [Candidatus Gracilibacteria bacterium]
MKTADYKIWDNPTPIDIQISQKENVEQGKWLKTQKVVYKRNREEKVWEMISRGESEGVISVLPVTQDGNIILLEEIRVPMMNEQCNGRVISMPAGLVDIGDTREYTAKKELQEEVGFTSEDIHYVDTIASSEGMTDEEIDIFIALNCIQVSEIIEGRKQVGDLILGHGESENIISIYSVPYEEIDNFLQQAREEGMKKGGKIDCALRHYENKFKNVVKTL